MLIFNKRKGFFFLLVAKSPNAYSWCVCSGGVHSENIVWQSLKQGVTHRPALHLTHLLLHVGCAPQTEHTHKTYQPYPLSQAVIVALRTRQATFVTADFFLPWGIREPWVFLLHIQDFPHRLFENLNEKSWLHKTHNYLEWEGQKSAFLFQSTLIHQIGVCHAFSLIGVQFVHGVSFNSGWLKFLDYLTLEAGTNRPCESVGIQLPVYAT